MTALGFFGKRILPLLLSLIYIRIYIWIGGTCTNTSTVQIHTYIYDTYKDTDMHPSTNIDTGYGIYPISIATPTPSQNYKRVGRGER